MITKELISPKSIVVVGGSDDTTKPGGNVLKNLLETGYKGELHVVNPKSKYVQGVKAFNSVASLPQTDCAILAIAARMCPETVEILCRDKGCKAVIIFSAGFHEDGPQGAELERQVTETANRYGASLIGPNCIGIITGTYAGVFTRPVTNLSPKGVDIISGSGATVVFIMEEAVKRGIAFSHVFSVGNSAQIGVEDCLEYLDNTYEPGVSSPVKLLYIESIGNPQKLLKHASSLIGKGARIAAIKAGYSSAGSRAASSHTGALATPDTAVDALLRKAGIIRVYSRTELVNMAAILSMPKPQGKNIAIITHAGGPAVMLTDILSSNGANIPQLEGEKAEKLLAKLFPGSSVANPIDFLATGTAAQLAEIIDACNNDFDGIDAMAVIFGSPGLTDVTDVYKVLQEKIAGSRKPIYPVLTSVVNAEKAIETFHNAGGISFNDEVAFGKAFTVMANTPPPCNGKGTFPQIDASEIRKLIENAPNGYLTPQTAVQLLDLSGIKRVKEIVAYSLEEAFKGAGEIGFPLVMKVAGPVHKSDAAGVVLNVADFATVEHEFERMIKIKDTTAVLMQPMLSGTEVFIGAKREAGFGSLVMCGLGGIFIETLKDVSTSLAPVSIEEALEMIGKLKGRRILEGDRGTEGVNINHFAELVSRVSILCQIAPEIAEMDLNPLLGNSKGLTAVDVRIRICHQL